MIKTALYMIISAIGLSALIASCAHRTEVAAAIHEAKPEKQTHKFDILHLKTQFSPEGMSADVSSNVLRTWTQTLPKPSGFVLVREYVDSVKTDAGDVYQKVQYGWDYDQGVAVERIYRLQEQSGRISDNANKLISEQAQPGLTLKTTEAELQYAYALVRSHRDLKIVCMRQDARFYGGFSLRNDDVSNRCGVKSRCIHVIVSGGPNGEEALVHAIVDLALGQVIDAHYQGSEELANKPSFNQSH
jgi:hypothetical protein